jgi:rare lipoprotein A (peptidoglycan hydrolase)
MSRKELVVQARIAFCTIFTAALVASYVGSVARMERMHPQEANGMALAGPWSAGGLVGRASHYAMTLRGLPTASGELYRPGRLTAAHRSLPLGSRVRVTNLENGRSTVVRINDRGPFYGDRVIDLSHAAAREIGMIGPGSARVELRLEHPAR